MAFWEENTVSSWAGENVHALDKVRWGRGESCTMGCRYYMGISAQQRAIEISNIRYYI